MHPAASFDFQPQSKGKVEQERKEARTIFTMTPGVPDDEQPLAAPTQSDAMSRPYGSTDASGGTDRRRRSTISELTHDFRRSVATLNEQIHEYNVWSTIAICTSVLSMMYLLMNAFPYSGFMAMQLVPGLTHESAGTYAGILSGSFMIGRLFSAYPWGRIADVYGRKFVLIVSNLISALLLVAFGFSFSFAWAVAIRFLTGFGNGIMIVSRVSVTELARGDHELEAKGMGMVMSMVGYGMLLGPAIGGLLSEPMEQYPDAHWFGGKFDKLLTDFPFLLPNLVGALLCLLSTFLVIETVEETLPAEKLRSPKYFLPDAFSWLMQIPVKCWQACASTVSKMSERRSGYDEIDTSDTEIDDENSVDEDLKILAQKDFTELSALMTTRSSRVSYSAALHRPSVIAVKPIDESKSEMTESKVSANISSMMAIKRTRQCLISYWSNTFANCAVGEAFPLFCMAKMGGLGLQETDIGIIGAGSGLIFCLSQYFIFTFSMKRYGLHRMILLSSFFSVLPAILTPVSLLLGDWGTKVYLSVLNAILQVFFSNFNAGITIIQNRTVDACDRAKLNGLAAVGASIGRGFGPLTAGFLVAFSYSDVLVPTRFGSLITYSVLAALGAVAFATTFILEPEEEIEQEVEKEVNEDSVGIEIEEAAGFEADV